MDVGYDRPLHILPFDHRASFEKGLVGFSAPLTAEQTARVAASKQYEPSRTRGGAERDGEKGGRSLRQHLRPSQIITFSAKLPNAVVTMKASPTARERHASRCGYFTPYSTALQHEDG